MSIEISDEYVRHMIRLARKVARHSWDHYGRVWEALNKANKNDPVLKSSHLTDKALEVMIAKIEKYGNDDIDNLFTDTRSRTPAASALTKREWIIYCLANYHITLSNTRELVKQLMIGTADERTVMSLLGWTSNLFMRLEQLTAVLNERMPQTVVEEQIAVLRSQSGLRLANKRHDKPGGSHEMRKHMLKAWAGGKYKTKDECANKECDPERKGWSREACRKALRGAPDPIRIRSRYDA